jgi:NADH:ubiquinone oxidoreductase subunit 4 (subunit M)
LPEAHVEAPTPGSVILAGILLKLGSYAILRFLLPSLTLIAIDFIFFILILALIGFIYTSLVAFNQIDVKKIIAYSSIAHMNFALIGFFSQSLLGLSGAFIMMFGHALTSGALFLGIGVLYDRYKTRLIYYYSGLAIVMPIFSIIYFLFILSNFGFPGTVNFVGEFLITTGGFSFSPVVLFISTIGLILTLVYSLFFYNRIFFSSLQIVFINYYSDISRLEFSILFLFLFLVLVLGLYPNLIFNISLGSIFK